MNKTRPRHPATWTYEFDESAGHLYYFAPAERSPPPYRMRREVTAILDIAEDGTLAGVELVMGDPPPPPLASNDE